MPNNPQTWCDYQTAANAHIKKGDFDGIGFMFTAIGKEYVLFGVDIDTHTGDNPLLDEIQELFSGTYAEISPSGNGVHIIAKAKKSSIPAVWNEKKSKFTIAPCYYMNSRKSEVECYIGGLTNRYFTFTGNKISDTDEIVDKTDELLAFLDKYMKRQDNKPKTDNKPVAHSPAPIATLDTSELLEKARNSQNGAKFSALYDRGDLFGFNSQSEADLALCDSLAFWLGGDPHKIDEAFRNSALYREKWERADYREETITKAIASCNGKYYEPKAPKAKATSNNKSENAPKPPKPEYPDFINLAFDKDSCTYYTDSVNCPLLADYFRKNYKYFFVSNRDGSGDFKIFYYNNGVYEEIDKRKFIGYIKQPVLDVAPELEKSRYFEEVYNLLTTDNFSYKPNWIMNADERHINFKNGILDLETMQLSPHSPDFISTIQITTEFVGNVPTPTFDKFLDEFTEGDFESKQALLEVMGAAISNVHGYRFKQALFVLGEGNSGKSVLRSLTEKLIGKLYCSGGSIAALESRFGRMLMYNKRLYGSPDLGTMNVSQLEMFKSITGGDTIPFEPKGKEAFEYKYLGMMWFGCNEMPRFGGDRGEWVYKRMLLVLANHIVPPELQDKQLVDKLYAEASGIVYKAVTALKNAIAKGYRFTEPTKSEAVKREYIKENSPYLSFFEECCVPFPSYLTSPDYLHREEGGNYNIKVYVKSSDIHHACRKWCRDNSNLAFKLGDFKRELEQYGVKLERKTYTGFEYYANFTLTAEAKETYAELYG